MEPTNFILSLFIFALLCRTLFSSTLFSRVAFLSRDILVVRYFVARHFVQRYFVRRCLVTEPNLRGKRDQSVIDRVFSFLLVVFVSKIRSPHSLTYRYIYISLSRLFLCLVYPL
jgi:hypothetical protein